MEIKEEPIESIIKIEEPVFQEVSIVDGKLSEVNAYK